MATTRLAIDARTYLEHIRSDGERIAEVAEGHLDADVPSCPGNTVGSLLIHTTGVCIFWTNALLQNRMPDFPDAFPPDPLAGHVQMHARFVEEIGSRDPDAQTWTFLGQGPTRFWFRRAAQELAVHRWDFENAVGDRRPIDAALAADGVDEMLAVFGPKSDHPVFKGSSERFDGNGETFCLEATDIDFALTFTALPDRFDISYESRPADVTARGTASDLLLFLWGRVPPSVLDADGDTLLLDRWQERVKI